MFFDEDKLAARTREIERYRYTVVEKIPFFYVQEDHEGKNGERPPVVLGSQRLYINDRWKGRDSYLWLQQETDVPTVKEGYQLVGRFNLGKTAEGNSAGFESLLYINNQPFHGVDSNHQDILIPKEYLGERIKLDFRLWSGLEGGGKKTIQEHELQQAEFSLLHLATDKYYYRLNTIQETLPLLGTSDVVRQQLIDAVNQSLRLIDWRTPASDRFYQSITLANEQLRVSLEAIKSTHPVTIHALGHTHIDVAWLWQLKHTREKAARSFSTVLALMDAYPEYTFLQTQPQLYSYLKKDYPDIYAKIKEKIKSGQWEIGGGMWLEADCNIPSGESLVRQLLFGYHFMKEEFNIESTYLWLPDVFGYSWALPQILKKSGIDTFMTTKISWSQYNRMPHDTFQWRGIDGTEILTHFITTPDSGDWWYYTYNGEMTPKAVKEMWDNYRNQSVNKDLLLAYGYGDGGGGVNRDMLETKRVIEEMPGLPEVTSTRADDYFNQLQKTVQETDHYVHTWDGELYLEYHRGTYTSQAKVKRRNRNLEFLLRYVEWRATLKAIETNNWSAYPQTDINNAWEIVLRQQFHDIIPGTSIEEVYQDAHQEYDLAEGYLQKALQQVNEEVQRVVVFNALSSKRSGLLRLSHDLVKAYVSDTCIQQEDGEEVLIHVKDIPAMGYQHLSNITGDKCDQKDVFSFENDQLTTPYYDILWNDKGEMLTLYDKQNGRQVLASQAKGNVLTIFEDKPVRYDAWDIDLYYQEKAYGVEVLDALHVVNQGPLKITLAVTKRYEQSVIKQLITLYRHSRRIDFKTTVDWQQHQELMKVAFPVNIRATEATYDIQFGNVKRPTHWNTSWDHARFESVGHKWADLSERNYGVALLNDSKYGYDIKDNVMRLSLIKSGIHPDPEADQGTHMFTYSLLPHKGDWTDGQVEEEAYDLNQPLVVEQAKVSKDSYSLISLSHPNVYIDVIKKSEIDQRVIVRLHEYMGSTEEVTIYPHFEYKQCELVDLMERPLEQLSSNGDIVSSFSPYELKTYAFTL